MNHRVVFVRPCPSGSQDGNHEHKRTVRVTIMSWFPMRSCALTPLMPRPSWSASVKNKNGSCWSSRRTYYISVPRYWQSTYQENGFASHHLSQPTRRSEKRLSELMVLCAYYARCQQQICAVRKNFSWAPSPPASAGWHPCPCEAGSIQARDFAASFAGPLLELEIIRSIARVGRFVTRSTVGVGGIPVPSMSAQPGG
jgi:hypothetical protein